MRALHVVKTSEGAAWAAAQAAELVRLGVDVHVVLPAAEGKTVQAWRESGATIHIAALDLPVRRPWLLPAVLHDARRLVSEIAPDIIHSHFVGTTVVLRLALGRCPVPRVFQVPGPLHLEHTPYRLLDLQTAGPQDRWIGSSRCITRHYLQSGVRHERVFLSYYGMSCSVEPAKRCHTLNRCLGIPHSALIVGNANLIYAPKWFLGQRVGLKCHEDVIDALGLVLRQRNDVYGVLIGGVFGDGRWYEERLRKRAAIVGNGRILMPGCFSAAEVRQCWPDFDCAVHVPLSENCGGVVEPLAAGVPTIAGRVGGLPEVVLDGVTGRTVALRDPQALASAIHDVLCNLDRYRFLAKTGQTLVRAAFDVRRTASEILQIYRHILDSAAPRPEEFNTAVFAAKNRMLAHA